MTPQDANRYDSLIFDSARDLAAKHGRNIIAMRTELRSMGVINCNLLYEVGIAQSSPLYYLENYRGKMCDEGVIETIKDCLRLGCDF